MKTTVLASALLAALLAAPAARALDADGHCPLPGNPAAAEAAVQNCAQQVRDTMVKDGKLEKSWRFLLPEQTERVDGAKGPQWKLTFRNPIAVDPAKQRLYIFFSQPGQFIAANHTGQ